jgi:hypothetical protein
MGGAQKQGNWKFQNYVLLNICIVLCYRYSFGTLWTHFHLFSIFTVLNIILLSTVYHKNISDMFVENRKIRIYGKYILLQNKFFLDNTINWQMLFHIKSYSTWKHFPELLTVSLLV